MRFQVAAAAALLIAAVLPCAQADTRATHSTTETRPAMPQTPGFHDLLVTLPLNGQPRKIACTVYLPKGYDPNGKWPMVVYLIGLGDRGEDGKGNYNNGPPTALRTNKVLAEWAPFILLVPQCPSDQRWEMPGMSKLALDAIDFAKNNWAVDPDRIYLTGLSNGGCGVWNTALAAPPKTFAAIAPLCSIDVQPDKMPAALRGTAVLIICGGADDPRFLDGSRKMYRTLKDHQIDVTYAEVPGVGHIIWPPYYDSRLFYEYLLLHERGRKPATTRPSVEQLVAIGYTPPNSADAEIAKPLQQFLPWWFVSNCGRDNSPGLRAQALGRQNVFVTTPLGNSVPCRLMITTSIPKDKKTALHLTVAADPQGQWELLVRVQQHDVFKQTIGTGEIKPSTQPAQTIQPAAPVNPWVDIHVDLSPYAGDDVHLELLNNATSAAHAQAYWGKVQLTEQ